MQKREKLANIFKKMATWIDNNGLNDGLQSTVLSSVAEGCYAIAGFINGTRDYREACIHHKLKDEWHQNVKVQAADIKKTGSQNSTMIDNISELDRALSQFPDYIEDPLETEINVYLKTQLDELMERGDMHRLDAMHHLMSMDLTKKQNNLKALTA